MGHPVDYKLLSLATFYAPKAWQGPLLEPKKHKPSLKVGPGLATQYVAIQWPMLLSDPKNNCKTHPTNFQDLQSFTKHQQTFKSPSEKRHLSI